MSENNGSILRIENLKKVFFKKKSFFKNDEIKAVNDISFDVKRGSIFGLVGESGCGKTTAARCIVHLDKLTSGKIFFNHVEIGSLSPVAFRPYREKIQIAFQDPTDSLNPRFTVRRTIIEPLNLFTNFSNNEKKNKLLQIMELVGLQPEHLERYPHQLSTGQQQRVSVARAIITNPDFVVLDEPTSALDISVKGRILELLLELQEHFGTTYLLISHDLSNVKQVCEETAVMYLGAIMEIGPTKKLFSSPLHPYTKALLSAIPKMEVKKNKKRIKLVGELPSPINLPTGCLFSTRCPEVMPICKEIKPEIKPVSNSGDQSIACHLLN